MLDCTAQSISESMTCLRCSSAETISTASIFVNFPIKSHKNIMIWNHFQIKFSKINRFSGTHNRNPHNAEETEPSEALLSIGAYTEAPDLSIERSNHSDSRNRSPKSSGSESDRPSPIGQRELTSAPPLRNRILQPKHDTTDLSVRCFFHAERKRDEVTRRG